MISFQQRSVPFIPLVISSLTICALGVGLTSVAAFTQNTIESYLVAGIMAMVSVPFFTVMLYEAAKSPEQIDLTDGELVISTHPWGSRDTVSFRAIRAVRKWFWNSNAVRVFYEAKGQNKVFFINAKILVDLDSRTRCAGELLEIILEESTEIVEFDLDSFVSSIIEKSELWGKTPNWTILNLASRRAKINFTNISGI